MLTDIFIDVIDPESLQPTDIERLNVLESQIFGSDAYPRYFFRQIATICDGTFLVARDAQGTILAYVVGAVNQHSLDESWILSMCVDTRERKKGIGSALIRSLIDIFREKRVESILVTVEPGNTVAQKLYEKNGFKVVKLLEHYHGQNYHRYLMKLKLA